MTEKDKFYKIIIRFGRNKEGLNAILTCSELDYNFSVSSESSLIYELKKLLNRGLKKIYEINKK